MEYWYITKTKGDVSHAELYKRCVALMEVTTLAALAEDRS